MLTGEVKAALVDVLVPMVEAHQAARAKVTDDVVKQFMAVRPLEFGGRGSGAAAATAAGAKP
jgi:tryptophanyl-tRNA synthetase